MKLGGLGDRMDGESASFKEMEFFVLKKGYGVLSKEVEDGRGGFFGDRQGFKAPEGHAINPWEIERCAEIILTIRASVSPIGVIHHIPIIKSDEVYPING